MPRADPDHEAAWALLNDLPPGTEFTFTGLWMSNQQVPYAAIGRAVNEAVRAGIVQRIWRNKARDEPGGPYTYRRVA